MGASNSNQRLPDNEVHYESNELIRIENHACDDYFRKLGRVTSQVRLMNT